MTDVGKASAGPTRRGQGSVIKPSATAGKGNDRTTMSRRAAHRLPA
ncbi:hypothetical protein QT383_01550 [Stenotrophomonas rhizophila]